MLYTGLSINMFITIRNIIQPPIQLLIVGNSFADEETRKRMSVSKDAVCYFIVKLDENGYITQIKSVIEEDRDITVDYTTKELSPQEASALGGKITEVLMGNNLVSNFTNIKGSISNPNVKKTFVFEIKTKQ